MLDSTDTCSGCEKHPLAYIENHKESSGYGWCNSCKGWFRPWRPKK